MKPRVPMLALCLSLVLVAACDQADEGCLPMTKVNPEGKAMGASCTKNDECQYGFCYLGSSHTAGDEALGFCSRTCSCGEDCADEGFLAGTEPLFTCQRPSSSSGSTDMVKAFCAPQCVFLDDCEAYDPMYTTCRYPDTGAPKKLCFAE